MTSNDPIAAVLDQLAAHHEQITQLDAREAGHYAAVTGQLTELTDLAAGIGRTLEDHAAALARLDRNQPSRRRRLTVTSPGPRRPGGS